MSCPHYNQYLLPTFRTPTEQMLDYLAGEMRALGYPAPARSTHYAYFRGSIPLLLIAHVDTVHAGPPAKILYDHECIWADTGLGADDRAGVWAILTLLARGHRPHVLFTDEEETGGAGARAASQEMDCPPVRLAIQLDRAGADDMVFYHCESRAARRYTGGFGFREAMGSFTDISILCPRWDLAGVNLSIGYHGTHTRGETLHLAQWAATVDRVAAMLAAPPARRLGYGRRREAARRWAAPNYLPAWYDTLALDLDAGPGDGGPCMLCGRDCACDADRLANRWSPRYCADCRRSCRCAGNF